MAEDTTIRDAIQANAAGPKKVSNETTSVEQHSIPDQIAADNHIRNQNAVAGRKLGVRFGKFTSPGPSEY